jgi:hypothetical protein
VGRECVRGRSSVVTGWGRIGVGGKEKGKEWIRRDRKSSWEGEQWIVAQEKEGK